LGFVLVLLSFASMPRPSLWSGNLRLSLVLIPVKLCPAISNEEAGVVPHDPRAER
jgi:hypothetical protein